MYLIKFDQINFGGRAWEKNNKMFFSKKNRNARQKIQQPNKNQQNTWIVALQLFIQAQIMAPKAIEILKSPIYKKYAPQKKVDNNCWQKACDRKSAARYSQNKGDVWRETMNLILEHSIRESNIIKQLRNKNWSAQTHQTICQKQIWKPNCVAPKLILKDMCV